MPAEIWVGQFSIVAGETREEGPGTALLPPRTGLGVHLYVLVEPTSASGGEVCQPLAAALGRLFQQQPLSLPGGRLAALRGAHQQLRDWNQKSLREHWVGAGATCLALRGSEAYLAQGGPSLAYCRQGERLVAVAPPGPPASEPIGTAEAVYPPLRRPPLERARGSGAERAPAPGPPPRGGRPAAASSPTLSPPRPTSTLATAASC